MKSNSHAAQAEKSWRAVVETLENNLLICVIVLHEQYGFGAKRLSEFVAAVHKKSDEFDAELNDGVFEIRHSEDIRMYREQFRAILAVTLKGLLPHDMYTMFFTDPVDSFQTIRRNGRAEQKRENAVTVREAQEMRAKMLAFTDCIRNTK